jgi:coenzyme F420-0:L-glutamate ligase/coenzyme F420-1:gamma-L-glutamate ligase
MKLTLTTLPDIPLVQPGDDLVEILWRALAKARIRLRHGDILALASKIVSKAEGRLVHLSQVIPSEPAQELARKSEKDPRLVELILRESREVLRVRPGAIIVEHRLGFVCANAGIDHSNVAPPPDAPAHLSSEEWVLLLPENPSASAARLRKGLEQRSGAQLGVLIVDSHGRAWRIGTVGNCIGLSGLPAIVDERGWKDLFGYELRVTVVGVADELAAAASLLMGQAAEATPAVHIRGFPYPLCEGNFSDLLRPKEQDLFR